jgi:hypothetical protein
MRTELARRTSDGIDVYLFWNEPTNRVTVGVLDARTDDGFRARGRRRHALDAFSHPYAYAGRADTAWDTGWARLLKLDSSEYAADAPQEHGSHGVDRRGQVTWSAPDQEAGDRHGDRSRGGGDNAGE